MSQKQPHHSRPPAPEPKPLPQPVKKQPRFSVIDFTFWGVTILVGLLLLVTLVWGACAMTECAWHHVRPELARAVADPVSAPPSYAEEFAGLNSGIDSIKADQTSAKDMAQSTLAIVAGIAHDNRWPDKQIYAPVFITNTVIEWRTQYLHLPPVYLIRTNTVEHTNWLWHAVQTRR